MEKDRQLRNLTIQINKVLCLDSPSIIFSLKASFPEHDNRRFLLHYLKKLNQYLDNLEVLENSCSVV